MRIFSNKTKLQTKILRKCYLTAKKKLNFVLSGIFVEIISACLLGAGDY